ncbi:MAG: SDR family oxidoreductase [Steroidobacteraceae bacterium]
MVRSPIAIVTGSATGIGHGIAQRLAAEGWHVAMISRNAERLQAAATAIGSNATAHPADLSRRDQVERVVAAIAQLGNVKALVNNAGAGYFNTVDTPLAESEKIWDECLDNNLKNTFLLSVATIPHLSAGSAIVNLSSVTAHLGSANYLAYAAAKAGIEGLTRVMANSLATRDITCNVIEPGFYAETGQTAGWDPKPIVAKVPLGRAGKPEDIAGAVAWLLSSDARYITGAILPISGGWRQS